MDACSRGRTRSGPGPDLGPNERESYWLNRLPKWLLRIKPSKGESYRYELWKLLVDDEWSFDYLGTQEYLANYPDHSGLSFDNDHEGRGGWTSGQILSGLPDWLEQTGEPDIVLFAGDYLQLQNSAQWDVESVKLKALIDDIRT